MKMKPAQRADISVFLPASRLNPSNRFLFAVLLFLAILVTERGKAQSYSLNTTGALPDSSAMLDLMSANKGFLIPRVSLTSLTDSATITHPAISLQVYNTNASMTGGKKGFWSWNGKRWVQTIGATGADSLAIGATVTTPMLIGGTTTTSSLTYKTTTAAGTTGADHIFKVGTNGGTEAMRILNSGNVGIGTTSPAVKLHNAISSSQTAYSSVSASDIGLGIQNTNTTANNFEVITFMNASGGGQAHIGTINLGSTGSAGGKLFFATRPTSGTLAQRMLIDENGNVGIGTTSPGALLNIVAPNGGPFALSIRNNTFSTSETGAFRIYQHNGGVTHIYNNNVDAIDVTTTGDVGIGTTTPAARLEVAGASGTLDGIKISGTNNHLRYHDAGGGTDWFTYMTGGDGKLRFYHSGDKVVFDNSGNVGIGTTTPGYKLDVQGGDINASGSVRSAGTALTSDRMFKIDIDSLQSALTIIQLLKPRSYYFDTLNYNGEGKFNFGSEKQYGFLAQDVAELLPELVSSNIKPCVSDTLGNITVPAYTYKTLNYNAFIPILTKGIQELQARNEMLENQLNQLTQRIQQLEQH